MHKAQQEKAPKKSLAAQTPPQKELPSGEGMPLGEDILTHVASEKIDVNPYQPRLHFDEEKLDELSRSIKAHGILQPLIVNAKGDRYELIAGERRLQAARRADVTQVPVIVRSEQASEQKKLELALIENIQRHDLDVIEEARAYKKLADKFALSQEEIAAQTGKSRSAIANRMRLLQLPIDIQKALSGGVISEGHAKAILALSNSEKQRALFDLIVKQKLTVRQAEEKTKGVAVRSHVRVSKDARTKEVEDRLSQSLGTKVHVSRKGESGKIVIDYYSDSELDAIIQKVDQKDS